MKTKTALFCLGPAANGALEVRQIPQRYPAADEVEIAVEAASVNPIDVRRAQGYGARLLSLVGAGKFPLVLGNDFAGTVVTTGKKVAALKPGDRVYGLKRTSAEGTHANRVVVKGVSVLPAPSGQALQALAVIPYSFVTMWLAVRGAGLTRKNAAGKKVLVHGAAGGTRHARPANAVSVGLHDHRHRDAAGTRCLPAGRSRGRARRRARTVRPTRGHL